MRIVLHSKCTNVLLILTKFSAETLYKLFYSSTYTAAYEIHTVYNSSIIFKIELSYLIL